MMRILWTFCNLSIESRSAFLGSVWDSSLRGSLSGKEGGDMISPRGRREGQRWKTYRRLAEILLGLVVRHLDGLFFRCFESWEEVCD